MKAGNASDPGSLKRDCEIALEKCHVLGYTCHVGLLYPNCQQKMFAHHRADFWLAQTLPSLEEVI